MAFRNSHSCHLIAPAALGWEEGEGGKKRQIDAALSSLGGGGAGKPVLALLSSTHVLLWKDMHSSNSYQIHPPKM